MARKNIIDRLMPLIAGTIIFGFGWIAIRGFASYFDNLDPTTQVIIGIVGVLVAGWLFKDKFGITPRKLR